VYKVSLATGAVDSWPLRPVLEGDVVLNLRQLVINTRRCLYTDSSAL